MPDASKEKMDVVPSLMDLLNEKVKAAGVTRREIRTNFDKEPRSISGYLNWDPERGLPKAAELDQLVTAVAVELREDRFDLWHEAVDRAKARVEEAGRDGRQAVAEAARAARLRDQA